MCIRTSNGGVHPFLQREMDRDHREQRDHDNLNEKESNSKIGMDFRNLSHHHDHAPDADAEVCFACQFPVCNIYLALVKKNNKLFRISIIVIWKYKTQLLNKKKIIYL